MITFLDGVLVEKTPARLELDVAGVGYEVFIALSTFERLPDVQKRCRLLIYDYIREDQHSLFGFLSSAEREVFTKLMNVSGIGPKLALSALSSLSVGDLVAAVASSDVEVLSSISGIGRKKAERMILELREQFSELPIEGASPLRGSSDKGSLKEAVEALVSLGYRRVDARKKATDALAGAKGEMSVEEIVRAALSR